MLQGIQTSSSPGGVAGNSELVRGTQLLKYGRRGRPHYALVRISPDGQSLHWVSSVSKKERRISLSAGKSPPATP